MATPPRTCMRLAVDDIAGHLALRGAIRRQAQSMLPAYETTPWLAPVFALPYFARHRNML